MCCYAFGFFSYIAGGKLYTLIQCVVYIGMRWPRIGLMYSLELNLDLRP